MGFRVKLPNEDIAEIEGVRDVATETNFGTKIALTGFVWQITTRRLHTEGVWVVSRHNADIADTLQLRDVAMATVFGTTLVVHGLWWEIATWDFVQSMANFQSTPTFVGRTLWFHNCGSRNCSRRATVRLGIDTLIANILVCSCVVCFVELGLVSSVLRRMIG